MTVVNQGREVAAAQRIGEQIAEELTRELEIERARLGRRLLIVGRLGVLGSDLLAEAEYTRRGDDYAARCRRVANIAADATQHADRFLAYCEDNGWEVLARRVVDDLVPALLDWDGNNVDEVTISDEAKALYHNSEK